MPATSLRRSRPEKQKRRHKAPFCLQLEAEVGIEPAYTALQAAA